MRIQLQMHTRTSIHTYTYYTNPIHVQARMPGEIVVHGGIPVALATTRIKTDIKKQHHKPNALTHKYNFRVERRL